MKNQNDLIFSIVFGVLGLIAFGIAIATKQDVPAIPAPTSVVTTPAALPATAVVYGTSLPGGGGASGGGGFGGGGRGGPGVAGGFGPGGAGGRGFAGGPPPGFAPNGPGGGPGIVGASGGR